MRNLSLNEQRCRGADKKFNPTICPARQSCQRFVQIDLDRQLDLPEEVTKKIQTMNLPRVGSLECWYRVEIV